jgi:hypothetical protein
VRPRRPVAVDSSPVMLRTISDMYYNEILMSHFATWVPTLVA